MGLIHPMPCCLVIGLLRLPPFTPVRFRVSQFKGQRVLLGNNCYRQQCIAEILCKGAFNA